MAAPANPRLDIASAAYMAAVLKYPTRNLALRHDARIIKRHDGEPGRSRRGMRISRNGRSA